MKARSVNYHQLLIFFSFWFPVHITFIWYQQISFVLSYRILHASSLFSTCQAWQASWGSSSCFKAIIWHYFKACQCCHFLVISSFLSPMCTNWELWFFCVLSSICFVRGFDSFYFYFYLLIFIFCLMYLRISIFISYAYFVREWLV